MARPTTNGKPVAVYLILDPAHPRSRCYLASSTRPQQHLWNHVQSAIKGQDSPKADWLREIIAAGRRPKYEVVRWCREDEAVLLMRQMFQDTPNRFVNAAVPNRGNIQPDVEPGECVRVVKPAGHGAHVIVPKEWLGRSVRVLPIDD